MTTIEERALALVSAPYSIRRTNAGWKVTWHRFHNETTLHPTGHDAEQAAERIYGSPHAARGLKLVEAGDAD